LNTASTQKIQTQESTQQQDSSPDIEIILKEYHNQTKEKYIPPFEWIRFDEHLPLDNDDYILVWNPKAKALSDNRSFIMLQHYLYAKYMKWPNESTHWMRIALPED
jgi:hypothetical protein